MKRGIKLKDCKIAFLDNEYMIMSEIMGNENLSQRELSKKLGVSVSTINVLMNKMIKEGLIKMTHISQKQVLYILTPAGILEKTKKAVKYLKFHYRVINESKKKIMDILEDFAKINDNVFIRLPDDEMGEIINMVIKELQYNNCFSNIKIIGENDLIDMETKTSNVLLYMAEEDEFIIGDVNLKNLQIINLSKIL